MFGVSKFTNFGGEFRKSQHECTRADSASIGRVPSGHYWIARPYDREDRDSGGSSITTHQIFFSNGGCEAFIGDLPLHVELQHLYENSTKGRQATSFYQFDSMREGCILHNLSGVD